MGEKIRDIREGQNVSQDELAERSGISRQTISAIESGRATNVTTGTLVAIARALGVSVSVLFC